PEGVAPARTPGDRQDADVARGSGGERRRLESRPGARDGGCRREGRSVQRGLDVVLGRVGSLPVDRDTRDRRRGPEIDLPPLAVLLGRGPARGRAAVVALGGRKRGGLDARRGGGLAEGESRGRRGRGRGTRSEENDPVVGRNRHRGDARAVVQGWILASAKLLEGAAELDRLGSDGGVVEHDPIRELTTVEPVCEDDASAQRLPEIAASAHAVAAAVLVIPPAGDVGAPWR